MPFIVFICHFHFGPVLPVLLSFLLVLGELGQRVWVERDRRWGGKMLYVFFFLLFCR